MDGATMLHICAMEGSLEVMEYLLTLPEVDVNAMDGFMETPVFFAAYWGWYEVCFTSIMREEGIKMSCYTVGSDAHRRRG